MTPTPPLRVPQHLETAVQRVRMAARAAAERTVDSLGLAALSSNNVFQRDALLGAQFELNRKLAIFSLTFNEALDKRVAREAAPRGPGAPPLHTDWTALSLVEDREVENQVSAERFALEIQHECEWEIREVDGYICALLGLKRPEHEHNPLRPELVGMAMMNAVDAITVDRPETRKVLATEIGRALASAMRQTYIDIVHDLKSVGVTPVGLAVRSGEGPGFRHGHYDSGYDRMHDDGLHSQRDLMSRPDEMLSRPGDSSGYGSAPMSMRGSYTTTSGPGRVSRTSDWDRRLASATQSPDRGHTGPGHPTMGSVDAELMSLMRRLNRAAGTESGFRAGFTREPISRPSNLSGSGGVAPMAPNIIVEHREELRRAATGSLDHMVIDVVGSLFDQILSDPKVPPQMARLIARLQLPVLRAALGDASFFSSRRHPVRRFVNRIASLGCAFEDFDDAESKAFLSLVRELVQEVIEGEFDQVDLYEQKLSALERFIVEAGRREAHRQGQADELLARKERELHEQRQYAATLQAALQPLPVDQFLRDFVAKVWSRVVLHDARRPGSEGAAAAAKARQVGRDLVMSVQPKGTPPARKAFLMGLPQLMKDLNAGMDRIALSETLRRDFFAKLLPAHAESLKGQTMRTLDFNLLSREIDQILAVAPPEAGPVAPMAVEDRAALQDPMLAPAFSPEEAKAIGLVDEASFDWDGKVDIEVGAEPEVTAVDIRIEGLPEPEAVEPTRGKTLADHVQIGFAYQMHLEGGWHKVRLTHMSQGRTFFVFTRGRKHKQTISMTYRMLERLCETGRMRAFENGYLLERATARARRQLAQVGPASRT